MIQKYIKFENNRFAGFFNTELKKIVSKKGKKETVTYEPATPYPDHYVLINDEEHDFWHGVLSEQQNGLCLYDLALEDGKIVKVDKYTEEEKANIQREKNKLKAQRLIELNEYRWTNQIKWNEYTDEERNKVINYYNALRAVVRGESNIIPEL